MAVNSGGNPGQEAAVLLLLDAITHAKDSASSDLALFARNAAFGAASGVIDDAFELGMQRWRENLA